MLFSKNDRSSVRISSFIESYARMFGDVTMIKDSNLSLDRIIAVSKRESEIAPKESYC